MQQAVRQGAVQVSTLRVVGKEIRVDPGELVTLAQAHLAAVERLADVRFRAQGALSLPADVFGDLPAAARLHTVLEETVEDADSVVAALASVYEDDANGLFQSAFNYQALDEGAAASLRPTIP